MDRIPTLPVFFKLDGKRVIIAGGGEPAVWKAEVLASAGAKVEVIAAEPCSGLEDLASALEPGALTLTRRDWRPEDLAGAAMALGAIEDDDEAGRFRNAALAAAVPVNVIDKPAFCDFQFGTIVARSPLVIAITTDGAAPVFGQALRTRIEALLPLGLKAWAQAAKDWRPSVQARAWDFRRRRRFWETFTERALQAGQRAPDAADQAACFAAVEGMRQEGSAGMLTLVGSGTGLPDALTFAAARALQAADLILYDPDVTAATLDIARREARRMPAWHNEAEVADLLLREAALGQKTVWLGTGNPLACRQWRRRADLMRGRGPVVERIPGLSLCPRCDKSVSLRIEGGEPSNVIA